jgi:hypothetical protein
VCIVADDAKELNELISSHLKVWEDASMHGWYEKGNKGHTLLSYALEKGSADCAASLMDWDCVPDDAMRETSVNIMADDNTNTVVRVEKRIVKGYENLFDWHDVERAQAILIDMYDHGLSATVEEVKDALNTYYSNPVNTVYINDKVSWISSKKPTPPPTIIIICVFLDFNNNNNNNNNFLVVASEIEEGYANYLRKQKKSTTSGDDKKKKKKKLLAADAEEGGSEDPNVAIAS